MMEGYGGYKERVFRFGNKSSFNLVWLNTIVIEISSTLINCNYYQAERRGNCLFPLNVFYSTELYKYLIERRINIYG